jgi:hypothetical protein
VRGCSHGPTQGAGHSQVRQRHVRRHGTEPGRRNGEVDSENGFGALIRTAFTCNMQGGPVTGYTVTGVIFPGQ